MNELAKFKDLKIMMCSSDSNGCGFHRIMQPATWLKTKLPWTEYALGFPPNDQRLVEADVIFLQRACNDFFLEWIPAAKAAGKKVVYDLDDCMWEIPATNLAHRHYPTRELKKLTACLKACDAVTTSTEPLRAYMQKNFGVDPIITRNSVVDVPRHSRPRNEKPVIGWAGSYTHNGDFDFQLCEVLRKLVKEGKAEFHTFGFQPKYFKGLSKHHEWCDAWDFQNKLIEINWDIGLVVAEDNTFNACKSNIKFIEYGLAGITSVAHDVYPYSNTFEHGVDGFLVKKSKTDWKEYLNTLVENRDLCTQMNEAAQDKIRQHFIFDGAQNPLEARYAELFTRLGFA